jgi:hypothetical protein
LDSVSLLGYHQQHLGIRESRSSWGLENSAIGSQERRSGLGLGLAKMYLCI